MLPIHLAKESGFLVFDGLIFGDQLALEVKNLLPIPATVNGSELSSAPNILLTNIPAAIQPRVPKTLISGNSFS